MRFALNPLVFSLCRRGMLLLAAGLVSSAGVASAPLQVTTLDDAVRFDGACSLREALVNAETRSQAGSAECAAGVEGLNVIRLPAGRFVVATSAQPEPYTAVGDLDIATDITLIGPEKGESLLVPGGEGPVFDLAPTGRLSLNAVRVESLHESSGQVSEGPFPRALAVPATSGTPSIRVSISGIAPEQEPGAEIRDAVYTVTNTGALPLTNVKVTLSAISESTGLRSPAEINSFAPAFSQVDPSNESWECNAVDRPRSMSCSLRVLLEPGRSSRFVGAIRIADMRFDTQIDEAGGVLLAASGYYYRYEDSVKIDVRSEFGADFVVKVPQDQLPQESSAAVLGMSWLLFVVLGLSGRRVARSRRGGSAVSREIPVPYDAEAWRGRFAEYNKTLEK